MTIIIIVHSASAIALATPTMVTALDTDGDQAITIVRVLALSMWTAQFKPLFISNQFTFNSHSNRFMLIREMASSNIMNSRMSSTVRIVNKSVNTQPLLKLVVKVSQLTAMPA